MITFSAQIKIRGVNPYVLVSIARAAKIKPGWRKPMPVLVRVNGKPEKTWRINMMPKGDGSFYLYLAGVVRKASGTKVGDKVQVDLEFDSVYRSGPDAIPKWFVKELHKNAKASSAWEALTASRQKEIVRYFAALKSDEARERNAARAIHHLSGAEGRFMARTWKKGK